MRELAPFSFLTGHHMPAPFLGSKRFSPKQGQETAHLSRLPLFPLASFVGCGKSLQRHPRLESVMKSREYQPAKASAFTFRFSVPYFS